MSTEEIIGAVIFLWVCWLLWHGRATPEKTRAMYLRAGFTVEEIAALERQGRL